MEKSGRYFLINPDDSFELSHLSKSKLLPSPSPTAPPVSRQPVPSKSTGHIPQMQGYQPPNLILSSQNSNSPSTPSAAFQPQPVPSIGLQKINCSNCKIELSYREDAYCVSCHNCSALTAVKTLSTHLCVICLTNIYYLANQKIVKCRCGKEYDMSKSPSY